MKQNSKLKIKFPKLTIFLKLVLTVLLFGIMLNVCVIIVFRLSTDNKPRKYLRDFARKMEKSIVYDIGVPPDTVKAKQICDDLEIGMRFDSPARKWTTVESIPTLDAILQNPDDRRRFDDDESIIINYQGRPYSVIRYPQGVFIIQPFDPQGFFKPERAVLMLILFITAIIILLYFLLRIIFKPLKELSSAVVQIGDGNYDLKVPVTTKDEFGDLAESINEMSSKISSSLKAKEQLLIDVSHELRSPLTRMKLGLEVGSSKEKIEEDVIEMERMVTGLLENYRADTNFSTLKLEKTDVADLLDDTISEYEQSSRLKFTKPSKEAELNVDSEKMQIVFRNLIDNALKYSTDDIEIGIREHGSNLEVSFKDKGPGIAAEDRKYIFEPFYRADRSRSRKTGGFGLGLSICKKIVDAHKGEIIINSSPGNGTEVIVSLKK